MWGQANGKENPLIRVRLIKIIRLIKYSHLKTETVNLFKVLGCVSSRLRRVDEGTFTFTVIYAVAIRALICGGIFHFLNVKRVEVELRQHLCN